MQDADQRGALNPMEAGGSPAEMQKLVGWTTPQTVVHYTAAHPDAQERTAAVVDRVLAV